MTTPRKTIFYDLTPTHFAVVQGLHVTLSYAIVLTLVHLGYSPLVGLCAVCCWAFPKDLIFDLLFEDTTLEQELVDLAFYIGSGLISTLFFLFWGR